MERLGQQIEDEEAYSRAFVFDPDRAVARRLHVSLDEDLRKFDKFLAKSCRRECRAGDEPGEIPFGGGNRMSKGAQHDRDITQRRCFRALLVRGYGRSFPEIDDNDIVLYDQEAAKPIIAVNADLDRAM